MIGNASINFKRLRKLGVGFVMVACLVTLCMPSAVHAQNAGGDQDDDAKIGYVIDVPIPLETNSAKRLIAQLGRLADTVNDGRLPVIMRYLPSDSTGADTQFEDALKVAREITSQELRQLRIISFVDTEVIGHSTLPILASDALVVTSRGVIANATVGESSPDETIAPIYKAIGARRGLFPPEIVLALVDPGLELVLVSTVDGEQVFAAGEELAKLKKDGRILREDVWSAADVPLRLEAKRLKEGRVTLGIVDSLEQAADELLDLAKVIPVDDEQVSGEAVGAQLEIAGSISSNRVRRWQSNLAATLDNEVNTWIITIDSGGGDFDQSTVMAGTFATPQPPLRKVAGLVTGEAGGDAALIALSCKPLYMTEDAVLGGGGSDVITEQDLNDNDELIKQIARTTKRPEGLIRGLLCPDLVVYRFRNKRTGGVVYDTEEGIVDGAEDPEAEREKYEREDEIEMVDGLSVDEAIELGLAEGQTTGIDETARRLGLDAVPDPVTDRGIVRFVEKLGRSQGLAFLLLFVGFVTLSAEANAPGLSIPGFIAVICFALYFWIKFLAGTAEWLELLLFALGLICIAVELFVIPGFGVFGVGGLALTVLSLILMSQTFVIPKNTYQIEELTRGIWVSIGAMFGLFGGFIAIRMLFPHVPFFKGLVMEAPDSARVSESEKLADFSHLAEQTGVTKTPLMPSGKAMFGDEIVAVVSEGTAIGQGEAIRVIEIKGNRIVVESLGQS